MLYDKLQNVMISHHLEGRNHLTVLQNMLIATGPNQEEKRFRMSGLSYNDLYNMIVKMDKLKDIGGVKYMFNVEYFDGHVEIVTRTLSELGEGSNPLERLIIHILNNDLISMYTTSHKGSNVLSKKIQQSKYQLDDITPLNDSDFDSIIRTVDESNVGGEIDKEIKVFGVRFKIKIWRDLTQSRHLQLDRIINTETNLLEVETIRVLKSLQNQARGLIVVNKDEYNISLELLNYITDDTNPVKIGIRGYGVKRFKKLNLYPTYFDQNISLSEISNKDVEVLAIKELNPDETIFDLVNYVNNNKKVVLELPFYGGISGALQMLKILAKQDRYQIELLIQHLSLLIFNNPTYIDGNTYYLQETLLGTTKLVPIMMQEIIPNEDVMRLRDEQLLNFTLRNNPTTRITPREEIDLMLRHMREIDAIDLTLTAGASPRFRVGKDLIQSYSDVVLTPNMLVTIFNIILGDNDKLHEQFRVHGTVETSYSIKGYGRYRVSVYTQRNTISMSIRKIPEKIMTAQQCRIPTLVIDTLNLTRRGLILITGATGEGKTTTLNALVNHINETRRSKVIMMEQPLEFMHKHNKSIIDQVEIGKDANDYETILKQALKSDPDVLGVQEVRTTEDLVILLRSATSGHLALATLHTADVAQTLDTLIQMSDNDERVLDMLSNALVMIVSQRLLPSAKKINGLVPVFEVIRNGTALKSRLKNRDLKGINNILRQDGNLDFDRELIKLYRQGEISRETVMIHSRDLTEFHRIENSPKLL